VIEQRLDLLVAVEIHVGVRVPVAREEALDFECPREMVGADEETSPALRASSTARRNKNARMRISLNSLSDCTTESRSSRSTSMSSESDDVRTSTSEGRPDSRLTSPVNSPG